MDVVLEVPSNSLLRYLIGVSAKDPQRAEDLVASDHGYKSMNVVVAAVAAFRLHCSLANRGREQLLCALLLLKRLVPRLFQLP